MTAKFLTRALIGAVLIVATSGPAAAGTKDDIRNLQERLARLENASAAQSAAQVRVSELEAQLQQLTGRIEELSYELDQANNRLNAISAALSGDTQSYNYSDPSSYEPSSMGSGPTNLTSGDPIAGEIARADTSSSSVASSSPSVELPLDPDAAFDYASGFLLSGDYQRAKAAFELYVEAFPNHPRTPDAQFRLGEIYLALNNNNAAASTFLDFIRSYPNDRNVAKAYLKLGTAFARLEKTKEACQIFKTMKTKFPNVEQAVSQRADIEMARIDCQ